MNHYINLAAWYINKLFDHPYASVPPLIVSGVGRSGTTVLRMSLGAHPEIAYNWAENNIVMDILETALHNCTFPSRKSSMQMSQNKYDRTFRNLLLHLLYPRPSLAIIPPKRWMASTDINPRLVGYLRQLFPNIRLIYLVRNGIEVVSSRMVFEGFKDRPFEWQCEVWARSVDIARWGSEQDFFYLLRHESLLNPESTVHTLSELWSWLGLNNEPRCADVLQTHSYHPTTFPGEEPASKESLHKRKSRWEYWNEKQREIFTKQCAPAMLYFGYEIPW